MAIDMKRITKGRQKRPPRVLVHSAWGLGKTTFAAGAPDPLIIDANKGSHMLNVQRVEPESWTEVKEWVSAVERGDVKCETLVLDTITDLELMSHKELFPNSTVTDFLGGWGKGDQEAISHWREFLLQLERIWLKGKTIVMVGHSSVKPFADPMGQSYDRYEVSARPRLAGLLGQWADYVLFVKDETVAQKVDGKSRGISTGVRWMYTKRNPAYDAKARGTTLFPERILLSWREFEQARAADDERQVKMHAEIVSMLSEIGDNGLTSKVTEFLRANPNSVVESHNRVSSIYEEKKKAAPASAEKAAS